MTTLTLAADGPGTFCATGQWLETFDSLTRGPLFQIEFVARARPPREHDGLDGMGDLTECRQLIIRGAAR